MAGLIDVEIGVTIDGESVKNKSARRRIVEHNADRLNKISNELDGKENMLELIEIFLQP